MKKILLSDLIQATMGCLLGSLQVTEADFFLGVGTDTRSSLQKQLFIALKGDNHDAHAFLHKAVEAGATGLLIQTPLENIPQLSVDQRQMILSKARVVVVQDTLRAFQDLAHFYRQKSKSLIVGVTGSNGKTTTKEFCGAIIGAHRRVHIPKGSFNNHWGVPMTLLAEPEGTEVSVIEMGMNHAGEIQRLCEIAEPEFVTVTMVGRAHIEHFGTIEKIAAAKEEIYQFARPEAARIYNLDNPWTQKMFLRAKKEYPQARKILSFSSIDPSADLFLKIKELTMSSLVLEGTIAGVQGVAKVPVFGKQNLTNILAATSVALSVGLTPEQIWPSLQLCKTSWGRNQLVELSNGAELMFDGYNANPDSMLALLENIPLLKSEGKKIGVFGQMKELGSLSAPAHEELGFQVSRSGFEVVWFYGDDCDSFVAGMKRGEYRNTLLKSISYEDSLASQVASMVNPNDRVLVKGSRGMKMERFVLACQPLNFSLAKES